MKVKNKIILIGGFLAIFSCYGSDNSISLNNDDSIKTFNYSLKSEVSYLNDTNRYKTSVIQKLSFKHNRTTLSADFVKGMRNDNSKDLSVGIKHAFFNNNKTFKFSPKASIGKTYYSLSFSANKSVNPLILFGSLEHLFYKNNPKKNLNITYGFDFLINQKFALSVSLNTKINKRIRTSKTLGLTYFLTDNTDISFDVSSFERNYSNTIGLSYAF